MSTTRLPMIAIALLFLLPSCKSSSEDASGNVSDSQRMSASVVVSESPELVFEGSAPPEPGGVLSIRTAGQQLMLPPPEVPLVWERRGDNGKWKPKYFAYIDTSDTEVDPHLENYEEGRFLSAGAITSQNVRVRLPRLPGSYRLCFASPECVEVAIT